MIEHIPTLKTMLDEVNTNIIFYEKAYNSYTSNEYKSQYLYEIDEAMRKRDALEAVITLAEKRDG